MGLRKLPPSILVAAFWIWSAATRCRFSIAPLIRVNHSGEAQDAEQVTGSALNVILLGYFSQAIRFSRPKSLPRLARPSRSPLNGYFRMTRLPTS
jgi:hypothetical protein